MRNNRKLKLAWEIIKLILASAITVIICVFIDDIYLDLVGSFVGFLAAMVATDILAKIMSRIIDKRKVATDKFHYDEEVYKHEVKLSGKSTHIWYYPLVYDSLDYEYDVQDDPTKNFELDGLLENSFADLMEAHKTSFVDNPTMIRLDDCIKHDDGKVELLTSRTMYYNDLVTNRNMDYKFSGELTVRKIYEGGKYLSPLNESHMSNHIGIIAHVFYGNNTILAQRGGNATISKNKYTTCIAVGLSQDDVVKIHNKKVIDERHPEMTTNDLLEGIIKLKLAERLNLKKDDVYRLCDEKKIKIYLLGLGQLVYTGGKPQFYYAVTIDESVDLTNINGRDKDRIKKEKQKVDFNKKMVIARPSLKNKFTLNLDCTDKPHHRYGEAERSFYIGLWHLQQLPKIDGVPDWAYGDKC